jgi:hypothetical protein
MPRTTEVALFSFVLASFAFGTGAKAQFVPGDIYGGQSSSIYNITAGGEFDDIPFAVLDGVVGEQFAWSADLHTMYVPVAGANKVVSITSAGVVSNFATGLSSPWSIIRTSSGRLLVGESQSGEVTDITAGGDFTGAAPFATGLGKPVNLIESAGRLLAGEFDSFGELSDITAGGVIGPAQVYATGLGAITDIAAAPGGLYVSNIWPGSIHYVTAPGDYQNLSNPFAVGNIVSMTYTSDGRLLACDIGSPVHDISLGGPVYQSPVFLSGTIPFIDPNFNVLDTVPVPEPSCALAVLGVSLIGVLQRRWLRLAIDRI